MKKQIVLALMVGFFLVSAARAENFFVTPVSGSLQSALTTAQSNGEEDTIYLAAGTYTITATATYIPDSDGSPLTIQGAGSGATILDGGGTVQILHINTTGLDDDSGAHINIADITFTNGLDLDDNNVENTGGLYIASAADITFTNVEFFTALSTDSVTGTVTFESDTTIDIPEAVTINGGDIIFATITGGINITNSFALYGGDISLTAGTGNINIVEPSVIYGGNFTLTAGNGNIFFNSSLMTSGSFSMNAQGVYIGNRDNSGTVNTNVTNSNVEFNNNPVALDISNTGGNIILEEENISVVEGNTITLNGPNLFGHDDDIISFEWAQISGAAVTLSDNAAAQPTFVASPVNAGSGTVSFEVSATDNYGTQTTVVSMTITDNGITGFPDNVVTIKSSTDENLGLYVNSGGSLTKLNCIDPDTIADTTDKPQNLIYGLVDLEIKVDTPGDAATVTLYLPQPAPQGYKWFKYDAVSGWYDFSDHAEFNTNRDQVILTLVDGGTGDDDGVANGVIKDPSGLGSAGQSSNPDANSVSVGGGGCFIATAACGSIMAPDVKIRRNFRDRFLLGSSIGEAFIRHYHTYSPSIADFIAGHDSLKAIVRISLLPLAGLSWMALKLSPVCLIMMFIFFMSAGPIGLKVFKRKNRK